MRAAWGFFDEWIFRRGMKVGIAQTYLSGEESLHLLLQTNFSVSDTALFL